MVLMADGLFRSALDVDDEGVGFTENQARATIRSLEKRKLLEATGFRGGSVRRTFGLTDAGRDAAAGLKDDREDRETWLSRQGRATFSQDLNFS